MFQQLLLQLIHGLNARKDARPSKSCKSIFKAVAEAHAYADAHINNAATDVAQDVVDVGVRKLVNACDDVLKIINASETAINAADAFRIIFRAARTITIKLPF